MHGNSIRHKAEQIDGRALWAEAPRHVGILLPVTDFKISLTNNTSKTANGRRHVVLYLELFCKYCDGYHYVTAEEGVPGYRYVEAEPEPAFTAAQILRACGSGAVGV